MEMVIVNRGDDGRRYGGEVAMGNLGGFSGMNNNREEDDGGDEKIREQRSGKGRHRVGYLFIKWVMYVHVLN